MSCCILKMLIKPSFDSQGEQLPSLAVPQALLTISAFGFSDSELLQYLTVFQADWWPLFLALQRVSACHVSLCLRLLRMPAFCSLESECLLFFSVFKPSNNPHSWLFRLWVFVVHCCDSTLMILGCSVGEWHRLLFLKQFCWEHLFFTFQPVPVSGCNALLHFKHADNTWSWHFRRQVTFKPLSSLNLLTVFLNLQLVSDCCL